MGEAARAAARWWPVWAVPVVSVVFFGAYGALPLATFLILGVVIAPLSLLLWRRAAVPLARTLVRWRMPWRAAAPRRLVRFTREPRGLATMSGWSVLKHAFLPFAICLALGSAVGGTLATLMGLSTLAEAGPRPGDLPTTFILAGLVGGIVATAAAPAVWLITLSRLRRVDPLTGAPDPVQVPDALARFGWSSAIVAVIEITALAPVQDTLERGVLAAVSVVFSLFLVYPIVLLPTFHYLTRHLDRDLARLDHDLAVQHADDVRAWQAAEAPQPAAPEMRP